MGFIDLDRLRAEAEAQAKSTYGEYLMQVVQSGRIGGGRRTDVQRNRRLLPAHERPPLGWHAET